MVGRSAWTEGDVADAHPSLQGCVWALMASATES